MGKMISTEYVQAGKEDSQIIMHNKTHGTRRSLKGLLKRSFGSQNKENEGAGRKGDAELSNPRITTPPPRISSLEFLPLDAQKPIQESYRKPVPAGQPSKSSSSSSSATLPYQSLRKAHPQFHDLLDVSNWPTLPPPTNPVCTPKQPSNLRQRPEQFDLIIRPCLDSHDSALPPPYSRHHDGRRY